MLCTIYTSTNDTPGYYRYEIIYDNPTLSCENIIKHYKKRMNVAINDITEFNEYMILIGDIIYNHDQDTFYFYTPELVEIKY
jgi:hypothetical protein